MNYKLTIYPDGQVDNFTTFLFETEVELTASANTSANLLLFIQDNMKIMDDYPNMFICEELIDGDWEEIEEN